MGEYRKNRIFFLLRWLVLYSAVAGRNQSRETQEGMSLVPQGIDRVGQDRAPRSPGTIPKQGMLPHPSYELQYTSNLLFAVS